MRVGLQCTLRCVPEEGTQVLEAGAGVGGGAGAGAGSGMGGISGNNDLGEDILGSDELLLAFIREVPSPQPSGALQELGVHSMSDPHDAPSWR